MNLARIESLVRWQKSSYSSETANCVEFAVMPAIGIGVRDSKDPGGPVLAYSSDAWRDFVAAVRTGAL